MESPDRFDVASVERLEDRQLYSVVLDSTFGTAGTTTPITFAPAIFTAQVVDVRNGMSVAAGIVDPPEINAPNRVGLARYSSAGKADLSFGGTGKVVLSQLATQSGIVVQSDNKIVVAGMLSTGSAAVIRLNANGTLDGSFGVKGVRVLPFAIPTAPRVLSSGKIVVASGEWGATDFVVARLTSTGQLDSGFGTAGLATHDFGQALFGDSTPSFKGDVQKLAIDSSGAVILGGSYIDWDTDIAAYVIRLSSNGRTATPLFVEDSGDFNMIGAIETASDGSVYVASNVESGGAPTASLWRITSNDAVRLNSLRSYSSAYLFDLSVSSNAQQIVGLAHYIPTDPIPGGPANADRAIVRWDSDGTEDHTFNNGGGVLPVTGLVDLDLQVDGKIVSAGESLSGSQQLQRRAFTNVDPAGFGVDPIGQLWVEGTVGDDTISVTGISATSTKPAQVRVSSRGLVRYFAKSALNGVVTVDGNSGNDTITVNAFNFEANIDGGDGNDVLTGGAGSDHLRGRGGNDRLYGGGGADWVAGDAGNDQLFGGSGNDVLIGGAGDDTLDGGTGADEMSGGIYDEQQVVFEHSGFDTVTYASRTNPVAVTLDFGDSNDGEAGEGDTVSNVQMVIGGSGNDILKNATDGYRPVILQGNAGDDLLVGGLGDDWLTGGLGRDRLYGRVGNDRLFSRDNIPDFLDGGEGTDIAERDTIDAAASVEKFV